MENTIQRIYDNTNSEAKIGMLQIWCKVPQKVQGSCMSAQYNQAALCGLPTTSELSTILLLTKVRLILEVLRYW